MSARFDSRHFLHGSFEMLPREFAGIAIRRVRNQIKEPRLALQAIAQSSGFLRDAGRSAIADRKDLVPGADPNSNCLAQAQLLLAPNFVVWPPATKCLDRQRSGGQSAREGFARATA